MDLWIRSQDKKRLIKAGEFRIGADGWNNKRGLFCNEMFVGEYETEKRILEVLDEIQNSIKSSYKIVATAPITEIEKEPLFIKSSGIELKSEQQQVVIYEMPEE